MIIVNSRRVILNVKVQKKGHDIMPLSVSHIIVITYSSFQLPARLLPYQLVFDHNNHKR